MRIIAGQFKGRKINFPEEKNTRPLRDFVRESIFNIIENSSKLKFQIEDSIVLDLFSGTGSFGLECISRGAKNVTFFENYPNTLKILKKNIKLLNVLKKCEIFDQNSFNLFDNNKISSQKFDLIFLDPPYREKNINFLIENILAKKILNKKGIIILHRHKNDDLEITSKFKIKDIRFYGISKILIGE